MTEVYVVNEVTEVTEVRFFGTEVTGPNFGRPRSGHLVTEFLISIKKSVSRQLIKFQLSKYEFECTLLYYFIFFYVRRDIIRL